MSDLETTAGLPKIVSSADCDTIYTIYHPSVHNQLCKLFPRDWMKLRIFKKIFLHNQFIFVG